MTNIDYIIIIFFALYKYSKPTQDFLCIRYNSIISIRFRSFYSV